MIAAFKSEIGPAQQQGGLSPGMVILQVFIRNLPLSSLDLLSSLHSPCDGLFSDLICCLCVLSHA